MNQELKNALKLITETCNESLQMQNKSLSERIESLQGMFLHYVDHKTIWYCHTQRVKKNPNDSFANHVDFHVVELSSQEKANSIEALKWFLRDIEACISHLED
jgi:hypothetical protein